MAERLRHVRKGGEGAEVDAGAHAVGSPEFDIVCVVMRLEEGAAMVGVPGADAIVEAAFGERIHLLQPSGIARDLPVAVELHDAA